MITKLKEYLSLRNILIFIIGVTYALGMSLLIFQNNKKTVCGKILGKDILKGTSQPYVVIYNEDLRRVVYIEVGFNEYLNTKIETSKCYKLSNSELKK
jgi:hypothetical protein